MRLYTCTGAPSPQRVTLYLAEKGIELPTVEVNLRAGEHLSDDFAEKSPDCTVPVLELDDGRCLWNSQAIRQYLERLHPEPPLLGRDAFEQAAVTQMVGWIEHNGLMAAAEAFRNQVPGMKDHAVPGRRPVAQIPALAERGRLRFGYFVDDLEQRLARAPYLLGEHFTVADIDAWVVLDFGSRVTRSTLDAHPAVADWRRRLTLRPAFAGLGSISGS